MINACLLSCRQHKDLSSWRSKPQYRHPQRVEVSGETVMYPYLHFTAHWILNITVCVRFAIRCFSNLWLRVTKSSQIYEYLWLVWTDLCLTYVHTYRLLEGMIYLRLCCLHTCSPRYSMCVLLRACLLCGRSLLNTEWTRLSVQQNESNRHCLSIWMAWLHPLLLVGAYPICSTWARLLQLDVRTRCRPLRAAPTWTSPQWQHQWRCVRTFVCAYVFEQDLTHTVL